MSIPFTNIKQLFIDGTWVSPSVGFEAIVNPATEEIIGEAPVGGKVEVDAAIAAARHAFDTGPWPRMSMDARIAVIRKFKAAIVSRSEEIKALLTAEVGAVYMLMQSAQFQGALDAIDYAIELAQRIAPEPSPIELKPNPFDPAGGDIFAGGVIIREPYGVVAGITPYNYPFFLNVVKSVPALLTGNTVVLKPSQFTPFSALLLGQIIEESGLPKGTFNIINGGPEVGTLLTSDPRVDLVTFTGSDKVGAAILTQSAPTLKRVYLELGGKSALIVRPDADLMKAAGTAAFSFTLHAGQGCALLTRYIVHNSIRAQFVEIVKQIVSTLKMGNPADPSVIVGPLIREAARQKTESYVEKALAGGARLVVGGKRPAEHKRGYFFEPTLFDDVDNRSAIAQEEVFGPIGVVIGYDTDEEAIALANDSRFGLSGAVMSTDRAAAYRMALRLRTGGVSINGGTGDLFVKAPFGGYKHSGIGREFGPAWLNEFMLDKSITYPLG
ncbi:aldehyde dehydrogenase family protein [Herminiimonas arsenitoxidans]|uniref:aldehyde dehydrogenase family protein n=1 Tax=Herminiimonas arsenitoxidans TaxID=1809410 RepID=UPI0009710D06|nr:aldehyde dehydrogenase family protein [Herminiimonas arsenitoxidans]